MNALSERLQDLLSKHNSAHKFFTLRELLNSLGPNSFGILLFLLSIPSAMPFPAPGISTPFGILNALLAIQMLLGRTSPWLPEKALNKKFKPKTTKSMLNFTIGLLNKFEHLVHPRLTILTHPKLLATLVLLLSIIMALPIPLTNSLPALIIFIISISIIESDGLLACIGSLAGILVVAAYVAALYIFLIYGLEGIQNILQTIKETRSDLEIN